MRLCCGQARRGVGNFDASLAEANFPLSHISLNFIFLGRISSALCGTDGRVSSVDTTACGRMASDGVTYLTFVKNEETFLPRSNRYVCGNGS